MIEPVDPVEGRELNGLKNLPRPTPENNLGLVKPVDRLGERIVVRCGRYPALFSCSLSKSPICD